MLTKFVVTVASVSSSAPAAPSPIALNISPGSEVPAALAAMAPSGISHALVAASATNTAELLPRTDFVNRE
jgi:hypothetical protein